MSGGRFDYSQRRIPYIVESINRYLDGEELCDEDVREVCVSHWYDADYKSYVKKHKRTPPNRCKYSEETIREMRKGVEILKKAYIYAERIDYLLSDDDGEKEFHERLKNGLNDLESYEES